MRLSAAPCQWLPDDACAPCSADALVRRGLLAVFIRTLPVRKSLLSCNLVVNGVRQPFHPDFFAAQLPVECLSRAEHRCRPRR